MTRGDRPSLPADLDDDARAALETLENDDPERLRAIGGYLEELATWKESSERESEPSTATEPEARETTADGPEAGTDVEYPDGVPERASVTVKEIAGTTYYYYQWRDGDRIESKTVQR